MTTAVVLVAAGSGSRLGSPSPKAFVSLEGKTLLQHCVERLGEWSRPHTVVLVVPEGWQEPARALLTSSPGARVVTGGATRTASVRAGLAALGEDTDVVLIHDAARALMPLDVFDRVVEAVEAGAPGAIPHVLVVDTLVRISPETLITEGGPNRDELGGVQTPQGFVASKLIAAYEAVAGDFSDDAAVMREAGHDVVGVAGDVRGFKITYPEDLTRAASVLGASVTPLVGVAMDVHQFDENTPLRLAGLTWEGEKGLSGHSDGDVVLHAIVDAALQAARLGDLGEHFGVDRPEFAGADSSVFLSHALSLLHAQGLRVSSVGVQVIGNAPKIGPRRLEAQETLTALVGAPVALSATTTDGLGLTGRGEGVAAIATVVLSTT